MSFSYVRPGFGRGSGSDPELRSRREVPSLTKLVNETFAPLRDLLDRAGYFRIEEKTRVGNCKSLPTTVTLVSRRPRDSYSG